MNLPYDWLVPRTEIPSDEFVIYNVRTWRFLYTLHKQLSFKTELEAKLALQGTRLFIGGGFIKREDWKITTYEDFLAKEPRVPTIDITDPKRSVRIRASLKETRFDPATEDFHRARPT